MYVEIPVEISTSKIVNYVLVRVLNHLVATIVTTPISTEVILTVIKLFVNIIRVTAILSQQ